MAAMTPSCDGIFSWLIYNRKSVGPICRSRIMRQQRMVWSGPYRKWLPGTQSEPLGLVSGQPHFPSCLSPSPHWPLALERLACWTQLRFLLFLSRSPTLGPVIWGQLVEWDKYTCAWEQSPPRWWMLCWLVLMIITTGLGDLSNQGGEQF